MCGSLFNLNLKFVNNNNARIVAYRIFDDMLVNNKLRTMHLFENTKLLFRIRIFVKYVYGMCVREKISRT